MPLILTKHDEFAPTIETGVQAGAYSVFFTATADTHPDYGSIAIVDAAGSAREFTLEEPTANHKLKVCGNAFERNGKAYVVYGVSPYFTLVEIDPVAETVEYWPFTRTAPGIATAAGACLVDDDVLVVWQSGQPPSSGSSAAYSFSIRLSTGVVSNVSSSSTGVRGMFAAPVRVGATYYFVGATGGGGTVGVFRFSATGSATPVASAPSSLTRIHPHMPNGSWYDGTHCWFQRDATTLAKFDPVTETIVATVTTPTLGSAFVMKGSIIHSPIRGTRRVAYFDTARGIGGEAEAFAGAEVSPAVTLRPDGQLVFPVWTR